MIRRRDDQSINGGRCSATLIAQITEPDIAELTAYILKYTPDFVLLFGYYSLTSKVVSEIKIQYHISSIGDYFVVGSKIPSQYWYIPPAQVINKSVSQFTLNLRELSILVSLSPVQTPQPVPAEKSKDQPHITIAIVNDVLDIKTPSKLDIIVEKGRESENICAIFSPFIIIENLYRCFSRRIE